MLRATPSLILFAILALVLQRWHLGTLLGGAVLRGGVTRRLPRQLSAKSWSQ